MTLNTSINQTIVHNHSFLWTVKTIIIMKVKIEQRSVYHKFVELEIEIPDSVETDKIDEYLLSIEDEWIDDIDHKINESEFVIGTGLYDHPGHEDSEAEHEWRYECEERKIGGHL